VDGRFEPLHLADGRGSVGVRHEPEEAARRAHARADREALAVVRAQSVERHRRMRPLRLQHARRGLIAAAAVHAQDLVGRVPPLEIGDDLGEVGGESNRLIVGGDDHGPEWLGLGRHSAQDQMGESARARRRATPVLIAARATSAATAGATFLLNTLGMMYSGPSSCLPTQEAMAWAAASFISSLTSRARISSRPRKEPGKHGTVLIWFG